MFTTFITASDAREQLYKRAAIVDCRYVLDDESAGQRDYASEHILHAVYADLKRDLSGPISEKTGRHPLPDPQLFGQTVSRWGISNTTQVIGYDDSGGAIAARLWWLLHWLGHDAVAVLDGGFSEWKRHGFEVDSAVDPVESADFVVRLRPDLSVSAEFVDLIRQRDDYRLLDARADDRYRGDHETIDPIAGHIPGALSLPFGENLNAGKLRPQPVVRRRFEAALTTVPASNTVMYCGSGVTACHNLLCMAHVGLQGARLYAGSWSEWITDPSRPVARGDD